MKICFFLGGFYQNGGIGRVTSVLANRLSEEPDIEIVTLTYFNPNKPSIYNLSANIVQEHFLESYQSMSKIMLKGGERKLRKYLTNNNIDLLIACGALFFPISVRACKGIHTKCICWEHSDPEGNNDHRVQGLARKYGIKKSDLNVVLTRKALRVYQEKYKAQNTIQIYNPIDPEVMKRSRGYDSTSKKIISVGRLTYQKNFELAIDVAAQVLPKYQDWEWDVFGMGEDFDKLVALTVEKNISDRFHFKGQISDLYDRYSDYAVMVMTSRYEGFPMTLLEGIGNGLPLISFDIPTGPDEIIDNGKNGFLIDAFDVDAMTTKLSSLIDSQSKLIEMSNNSYNTINRFSLEEIVKEWKEILNVII